MLRERGEGKWGKGGMGKEEKTARMATIERRQEEGKRDCDRRRQFLKICKVEEGKEKEGIFVQDRKQRWKYAVFVC